MVSFLPPGRRGLGQRISARAARIQSAESRRHCRPSKSRLCVLPCQRHTNPHHLNGVRSTFAARRPSARCDRWWIIRCKIAPPREMGRRGKSPSICKEHLKTENLNDLSDFLRCSPNTRHRRPVWSARIMYRRDSRPPSNDDNPSGMGSCHGCRKSIVSSGCC